MAAAAGWIAHFHPKNGLFGFASFPSVQAVFNNRIESLDRRRAETERRVGNLTLDMEKVKLQAEQRLDELARLGRDYQGRVGIVAISANDVERYPDDAPAAMARFASEHARREPFSGGAVDV